MFKSQQSMADPTELRRRQMREQEERQQREAEAAAARAAAEAALAREREIEASVPFYIYKMVMQLFFNEYEKTSCSLIGGFGKMLNKLLNSSKQQFISRSFKTKYPSYQYDNQRDDYLIAGNAFLTLLRAGALELNLDGLGNKIVKHNASVIQRIKSSLQNEEISMIDEWNQLDEAILSGKHWFTDTESLKQMWEDKE